MSMEAIATVVTNIPDFTKEQYLSSPEPYEWIMNTANGNIFKQRQLKEQVAVAAKSLGVMNFKTLFNCYEKEYNALKVKAVNMMNFTGTAIRWPTGDWTANDNGVYRETTFGDLQIACPHPIFILGRYVNVDTGKESLQIVYARPGNELKSKIVPRSDLANANKIVKLAEAGVGVTSENARYLVQYLSDFETINYDRIPEQKSCDHLGWIGSSCKNFAPYIKELTFEDSENFNRLFKSVAPHGSYNEWLDAMRKCRKTGDTAIRIITAASFASVLLKPLDVLPFFTHLWGETGTGKTVALMAAVSVWASPVIGEYAYTFNSTDVGNELYAACLKSLPLCMDELQILNKRSDFDDTIYRLCEGTGRLRGRKEGGVQDIKTWRNCILTTGERPITSMYSGGGAVNRVIEINCENKELFENPHEFCGVIKKNYGHAGKVFIEKLTGADTKPDNDEQNAPKVSRIKEAKELYERYLKELQDKTTATDKQCMAAAALLTADTLAEQWIFQDGVTLNVGDIEPFLQTKETLNADRRGYEYLREAVVANYNNFSTTANECWGVTKDGYIYVLKNRFNSILTDGGFNPQSTLAWMARNGKIAKHDTGRRLTAVRVNGSWTRCVCIHADDLDDFVEVDCGDDLPFDE